ncbi:MAG: HAMP domain-containing sensor histidine kinase, partial [Actinomycetota bacterium]
RRTASSELRILASSVLAEVDLVDHRSFDEVDLVEIVDQAIGAVGAGVDVELSGPEQCVRSVWVDGVRLAVENLLRNAIGHGRPLDGGAGVIAVTVTPTAQIIVDDNGPGIPLADRARILEPFERATTAGTGSGLGLAFVNRVAALHSGSVEVLDSPSGGTRIVLGLWSVAATSTE